MNKAEALLDVARKVTGDRHKSHGDSNVQLAHVTTLKRVLGHHPLFEKRPDGPINAIEVECLDSICVKLSRIVHGQPNEDDWLDIIGYAVCAIASRHKFASETAQDTMDKAALAELEQLAKKFAPEVEHGDKTRFGR